MAFTPLSNFWSALTAAHPSITDIETRRQSRLLASFILIMMATFSLMVIRGLAEFETQKDLISTLVLLSNVGILGFEYYLNRTGRYRASALMFVLLAFLFIHILSLTDAVGSPGRMFYIGVALLMSSILLSLRTTVILFFLSVGLQLGFVSFSPQTAVIDNLSPLFYTLVIGPLVLVFWQHRAGIERERQAELQTANTLLRESEANLERRVREQTRDLEVAAEVSRKVTTFLTLDELLPQVAEHTRAAFNLYHVSVFLFDDETKTLNYAAGTGEAGKKMHAANKHFRLDDRVGLVSRALRERETVLTNDITLAAGHLINPYLPDTRSELALPMLVGGRRIGVLDLQDREPDRFSKDDVRVLAALADQVAIAVENAGLYSQQVKVAEELQKVDVMKSQFLASMSHELRTPLNAILNFTEFVAIGMLGPVTTEQQDALHKALESGRHLLSLINDVLDITKIEAGMMQLFVENNIDLNSEIRSVIATAEPLLHDKPVKLICEIDDPLPLAVGDRRRIRQILLNLMSNAIKFTEEGQVTLRVTHQNDNVLFSVIDTGPGIAPEDHTLIFEPFQQTTTGIVHAGGTGLGLPITKRLIEAHGGRLWLESAPGEGAAFYVEIPYRAPHLLERLSAIA